MLIACQIKIAYYWRRYIKAKKIRLAKLAKKKKKGVKGKKAKGKKGSKKATTPKPTQGKAVSFDKTLKSELAVASNPKVEIDGVEVDDIEDKDNEDAESVRSKQTMEHNSENELSRDNEDQTITRKATLP